LIPERSTSDSVTWETSQTTNQLTTPGMATTWQLA